MWKKICYWVVGINYIIGVGCSIYFICKWLNYEAAQIICIAIQCVLFYFLFEAEKNYREDIEEKCKLEIQSKKEDNFLF